MTRSRHILLPRIPWGPEEDAIIRDLFPTNATGEVAALIDRSESSVAQRARRLGLSKDPEYLATSAHRLNGRDPRSKAHQFRKGQVPANKGLRRPGYAPGRMRETQFKKGRMSGRAQHNYRPIGTEKIDPKRKVLMRKVTDDPTIFPVKRWRPVHVIVWEAAHGPAPDGHIVVFRPGMKTFLASEITVDRLELVTLAENMQRNTIHNYPPEIKRAMQARGALNRVIRRIEKERTPS